MTEHTLKSLVPDFLLNSHTYYVTLTDLEGNYLFVNPLFKSKFKFLHSDFVGQSYQNTIHPDDVEKCNNASYQCILDPSKKVHVKIRKPDNIHYKFYWTQWEFSLFMDETQQPAGILCIGNDITDSEMESLKAKVMVRKAEVIIENITDGFYILNNKWEFVQLNPVAEKILGFTKEQLIGKNIWEQFPASDQYQFPNQFRRAKRNFESVEFEEFREDLKVWFKTFVYPSSEGLTVFFRDITKEKFAEELLFASENKLKAILDSTSEVNILISQEFKVLSFNRAAASLIESVFKQAITIGDDFKNYILPGLGAIVSERFAQAIAGLKTVSENEVLIKGVLIWFEITISPVYDQYEKLIGASFNAYNIHDRKEATKNLEASEYMLDAIYNSSLDGSSFVGTDLKLKYLNSTAENMIEKIFKKKPKVGDDYFEFIVPELQEKFRQKMQEVLKDQEMVTEEVYNEGSWFKFTQFPVFDKKGKLVGISDTVSNITNRKVAELKILEQNEALRNIARQQSHNVRAPVANILGLVDLMSRNEQSYDPQLLKYLKIATENLDQIIREIVVEVTKNDYP